MTDNLTDSRAFTRPTARQGITAIEVAGFKSLIRSTRVEIRPLTVLAGKNSSGKSSIVQPLLLLKQTIESSFDPGGLLLSDGNARYTSSAQFMSKGPLVERPGVFSAGIEVADTHRLKLDFKRSSSRRTEPVAMELRAVDRALTVTRDSDFDAIYESASPAMRTALNAWLREQSRDDLDFQVQRDRCFLDLRVNRRSEAGPPLAIAPLGALMHRQTFVDRIRSVIHLPGLRGSPARTYPMTAVGNTFPGTFDPYTASLIHRWQTTPTGKVRVAALSSQLERLGLTWKVEAKSVDDTQVELLVGRLQHAARGGARDMVSLADVGVGVSQTLPVLVALLAAQPGQLVYLEQPEIHLHPRAQSLLAEVFLDAIVRGVRVVAETHSALLLLGIQALVAEGKLDPSLVALHWFSRDTQGATVVTSAELDENGAFGDWPEDFGMVTLETQDRYLNAIERRLGFIS